MEVQKDLLKRYGVKSKVFLISLCFLFACGTLIAGCKFETEESDKGVVTASYSNTTGKRAKLMIEKDNSKYTYDLNIKGNAERFPLQLGDGEYKLTVLENTSGNAYQIIASTKVQVKMKDEKLVYLNSIQNINWSVSDTAIVYAKNLTQDTKDLEEKAKLLYNHMAYNYTYDYDKLASLPTTYLPNIESTFEDKTGICYDFSSLYAAMLRSQGIYAKLIKGYTTNATGYHAWNEVYDTSKKEWLIIDTTYDLQVIPLKRSVTMVKRAKDYQVIYEY